MEDQHYPKTVVKLLDSFEHDGPHGNHICMVFPLLGIDLLKLRNYFCDRDMEIPINIIKTISKQILDGMKFIHNKNVIHTDIKPENIMLNCSPEDILNDKEFGVVITDMGTACWTHKHFTDNIQTTEYRALESILAAEYDTSVDMWSVACVIFELLTGEYLFDPHSAFESDYDSSNLTDSNDNSSPKVKKHKSSSTSSSSLEKKEFK